MNPGTTAEIASVGASLRSLTRGGRQQLRDNEVDRMTSLHGLTIWNDWELAEQSPSSVTLGAVIEPQQGYPHGLVVQASCSMRAEGLLWGISALNVGPGPGAPTNCPGPGS